MDEQLAFAKLIASRLDGAGIPYMLTGSMAMALYATPRMTRDIDLVVECRPDDASRIAALFEADCYVDVDAIRAAAVRRSTFHVIHDEWLIKADFIVRRDEEYRELEFGRRRAFDVEGTPIQVVAPEDLVLSKLEWSRESGSEMQRRDARSILESVPDLDEVYLQRWATRLGIRELLDSQR
jgi:hypothetical protein